MKSVLLALLVALSAFTVKYAYETQPQPPALVLSAAAVNFILPGWTGDSSYAVVGHDSLADYQRTFNRVLSRQGFVRGNERFDCNRYVSLWVALAHASYARETWHTEGAAQALALAEVWHHREKGPGHAIVAAVTDRGLVFYDPQLGRVVDRPTGIFFVKW